MTLGEICQPPAPVVEAYSGVMANMVDHTPKAGPKASAAPGGELPDLELSYAKVFSFVHRLSSLLYDALDTPLTHVTYDLVSVDIKATVFVSIVKSCVMNREWLSGVGS